MNETVNIDLEIAAAAARAKRARKPLGTRIWENVVGDNDPNTQNLGERVGTLINMGIEAGTGGLVGDEAAGMMAGIGAALVPGGETFRDAYNRRQAYDRQQQLITEDEAPVASTVAKVAGAVPLALLTKNPQTVLGAAGLGARMGGLYGFMEGEGGFANRMKSGVAGGVIGGVLGAASLPLGKVLGWAGQKFGNAARQVFGNKQLFRDGRLTQEGIETLQALGYSVDDIDDAFQRQFGQALRDGLEPEQAANAAVMREFDIPVYRPNVTGLADDFATLERARRGAIGPQLEAQARSALEAQDMAAREAGEGIATRLAGGVKVDAGDAAEAAMTSARTARDASLAAARGAYDDLAATGAGVQGAQVQALGTRLARTVSSGPQPVRIDAATTPNAAGATQYLDDLFANAKQGAVPFMDLERARQYLVRLKSSAYRGSNGQDQFAMEQMVNAFDDQVDDLITRALTEGNEEVLDLAKNARSLWSAYRSKYTGKDAASKFIQKMIDDDATPDQVVNWMFGTGKLGRGGFNATVARGVREVVDPQTWDMIRSAAFRKVIQKPDGMAQMGPQAVTERIGDFFTNPATRDLSRTLFTKSEIATIMRYQAALKRMIPPPGAVNYSGTSYELSRMARQAFNAVSSMFAATTGGAPGLVAAQGANALATKGSNWITGRNLFSVRPPTSAGPLPAAAGIVGGDVGAQVGPQVADTLTNLLGQFRQQ